MRHYIIAALFAALLPTTAMADDVRPVPLEAPACQLPSDGASQPIRDGLSKGLVRREQALQVKSLPDDVRVTIGAQARLIETTILNFSAWSSAEKKYAADRMAADAALKDFASLIDLKDSISSDGINAYQELLKSQRVASNLLATRSNESAQNLCRKFEDFDRHSRVVVALTMPQVPAHPTLLDERHQFASDNGRDSLTKSDCIGAVEDPEIGARFGACLVAPFRKADATAVGFPDRPLRPRGFTASFTGSKSNSEITLSFANEFKLRKPRSDAQQFRTWGYSVGLAVDGGSLFDFDKDGPRNDKDFDGTFDPDRIGAGTKLTGGLSMNFYPVEPGVAWRERATKVRSEVFESCLKDRAANSSLEGCAGEDLYNWLGEGKGGGDQGFKHPDERKKYSDLYFGGPKNVTNARWGILLNGELARPLFKYKINSTDEEDRKFDFSVGSSLYWRPELGIKSVRENAKGENVLDFTGVLSLTYKHDWRSFLKSEFESVPSAAPVLDDGFAASAEARFLWRGGDWFPATAIFPKFSYDMSPDTSDRYAVDLPIMFLFGDKMDSAAGFKYTHNWGGLYDDGFDRPVTREISLVYQKSFSLNPTK